MIPKYKQAYVWATYLSFIHEDHTSPFDTEGIVSDTGDVYFFGDLYGSVTAANKAINKEAKYLATNIKAMCSTDPVTAEEIEFVKRIIQLDEFAIGNQTNFLKELEEQRKLDVMTEILEK